MVSPLYLDMDGVLADFDGAMRERGVSNEHSFIHLPKEQWTAEQSALDQAVRNHMETPDFWTKIPVMHGAFRLITTALEHVGEPHLYILTATPRETNWRARITQQKREWAAEKLGFPMHKVIVCLRSEKAQYAVRNSILIDDMAQNCKEWARAGGIGIRYTDADTAISTLRSIHVE